MTQSTSAYTQLSDAVKLVRKDLSDMVLLCDAIILDRRDAVAVAQFQRLVAAECEVQAERLAKLAQVLRGRVR